MAAIDDLQAAYDNVARNLRAITADPKPNYSLDGESYSWQQLFEAYTNQLEALQKAIQAAGAPFEYRSQGI